MKRIVCAAALFVAALLFTGSSAQAAQGNRGQNQDGVAFILSHAKDLDITDEQKTKLTAIQKDVGTRPARGADRTEYTAKMKEANEKAAAVLTKEQTEKLDKLKEKAAADKKGN